jgi:cell wall-associated NlpC family hydrolase
MVLRAGGQKLGLDARAAARVGTRIRPTTSAEAMVRARSMIGKRIRYSLGAGGRDPWDNDPATEVAGAKASATCDCAGFVAWALGFDRKQPESDFPLWGGWINTDSAMEESKRTQTWFLRTQVPEVGGLIVFGSVRQNGKRTPGHIGIVTEVPAGWAGADGDYVRMKVVHCSGGNDRRLGHAIHETNGKVWAGKRSIFLRYLRAV